MKITVLMENKSPAGLLHEHGLSLHFTYGEHSYLLDGAATGRILQNAQSLGVDLSAVDCAILSHGHYDHADGLGAFLALNPRARVCARPKARDPQYFKVGPVKKFIGVSPALLEQYGDRFDLDDGPRTLASGLHLIPDSVDHEQSVVAETSGGLVVMNACCHAGAGYIVQDILARFPGQRVRAILGGFHLMGLAGVKTLGVEPGIVKNLAHWLIDELGVQEIYTGHCTGDPAFALLRAECPDRVHYLQTGDVLAF